MVTSPSPVEPASEEDMDAAADLKPLRRSSTSINNNNNSGSLARRRTKSSPVLCRSESLGREIGHAASETYLITRLAFTLLRYLGVGRRWISRLLALGLYAMLLMPGFLRVLYKYFTSSQIRRSIGYGDQPRNRLDLYLPKNIDTPKPVIVFVTGGAWIIGVQLAERDIIVTCIDYRNFPQGTIGDMVEDVSRGYHLYAIMIYLMGQSAGAHIASCALLKHAIKESKGESVSWSASQINAYFGLSGGYNLTNLVDHFDRRGLYRSIFLSIWRGMNLCNSFLLKFSLKIQVPLETHSSLAPYRSFSRN
ncbi:putative alpha/Beta hydrolase [Helianthus annuus]|nr:putative alpha/Beta hydrolase [Helianthus annuus]